MMQWKDLLCPNRVCTADVWMVQRSPDTSDLWFVAAQMDDHPWTVAAAAPAYPLCSSTLCTIVELEDRPRRTASAEKGALFDFARSLTI